jgi:hypothetical protein
MNIIHYCIYPDVTYHPVLYICRCNWSWRAWGGEWVHGKSYTAMKNPFLYSQKLCGLSPNIHIHVSMSDIYIPRISLHTFLQRNRQNNSGIYKSLTDT